MTIADINKQIFLKRVTVIRSLPLLISTASECSSNTDEEEEKERGQE